MKQLSIRWRLTLWYGVSTALLFAAFAIVLVFLMKKQVFARIDTGLHEEVREIGLEVALATSRSELTSAANARFAHHAYYEFLIIDANGDTVFASPDLETDIAADLFQRGKAETPRFFTREVTDLGVSRIARGDATSTFGTYSIFVLQPLRAVFDDLRTLQLTMIGLLPIGIVASLVVGHFLTARALSPVQEVVAAANAINISCLGRRIEVPNPSDEIGMLAGALNSLIDRLESAVSEIRRFTADASHEIRTPITTLRMEAESALQSSRNVDQYKKSLTVITEEAARLSRLTDQLLHLSRFDAGIMARPYDGVRLDALLTDVVDQLRPIASARGIELMLNVQGAGVIFGDDILLSQALYNVIENAIKYSSSNNDVEIRLRFDGSVAMVDVEDFGIGISEENKSQIFERFFRADSSRQSEGGAGLGLAIARSAVCAHNGTINVRSQLGVGTVITITLPVIECNSDAMILEFVSH